MLRKDKFINGLVFGILLPILGFVFFFQIFSIFDALNVASTEGLSLNFRERTLAIVALGLNIIPLRIFAARRSNHAIRGLVITTFLWAALWFYKYGMAMM